MMAVARFHCSFVFGGQCPPYRRLLHELSQAIHTFVDLLHAGGETHANVIIAAETDARHAGNLRFLQQLLTEFDAALDAQFLIMAADVRKSVKSTGRFVAGDAVDRVEALVDMFGTFGKLGVHASDVILALTHGLNGRQLGKRCRPGRHMRLHPGDGPDDVLRPGGIAHPPTGSLMSRHTPVTIR